MSTYKMLYYLCSLMLVYGLHRCWAFQVVSQNSTQHPGNRNNINKTIPHFKYPLLYRDHIFTELSEKGRDIFYPVNIHPSCTEKKGQCIQRSKCVANRMIYISRVCYHRDLVCCFDDTIHFPVVEIRTKSHAPTQRTTTEYRG